MPEETLDPDEETQVRRVVGDLLDGNPDEILDRLEAAGWWEMWAAAQAASAQLFFATEGSRGTVSPALTGFALRLLGVGDVSANDGMVFGTDASGTAGVQDGEGAATIRGVVVGGRSARLVAVVRSGPEKEVLMRFCAPEYLTLHDADGWASPLRLVSGSAPAEELVGGGERWAQTWRFVRRAWATQLLAMSEAHLAAACDHCRERQQFGRSIASFQAVKHHLARVKVAIEAARPVVRASWETDSEFQTIAAKALAGAAYLEAHNRCIHVMGGMGYSREHPIAPFHATGLALEALGGSTRTNSQALASVARSSPSTLRSPVVL
jgi:alkylation response protein AidB-like acyl-CoA dehydrogenase